LTETRAIERAGKIVALEATVQNGLETVTHRFQPNTIASYTDETKIVRSWFDPFVSGDDVTFSIGTDYFEDSVHISNIMQLATNPNGSHGIFG